MVAVIVEGGLLLHVVFDEAGDRGDLGRPPGCVIVACALFVVPVIARRQPVQVLLKPFANGGLFLRIPIARLGEQFHALNGADEVAPVHDSRPPAAVQIAYRLGEFERWIHPGLRIDEPGVDVARGPLCVARVVQKVPPRPNRARRLRRTWTREHSCWPENGWDRPVRRAAHTGPWGRRPAATNRAPRYRSRVCPWPRPAAAPQSPSTGLPSRAARHRRATAEPGLASMLPCARSPNAAPRLRRPTPASWVCRLPGHTTP